MTKRELPLLDDPTTHSGVRDLLQAGRDANVSDYDYSAGLQRHIGLVQAGAPMPDWAKGLEAGAGKGAAAAAAGSGLVGWWALPVATVAVAAAIGATVLFRSEDTVPHARPHGAGTAPVAAPVVPAAPGVVPAAPVASQTVPGEQAERPAQGDVRAAAKLRSGSAQKAPQAKHAQAVSNAHGVASNAGSANNGGKADLFANAPSATTGAGARTSTQSKATTTSGTAAASAQNEPAPQAQSGQAAAASDEPAAQKPEPVVDDTRLEREMGMLAVAQRVLQVDPARTLSLARQGEAEFSGSMFTPERKQLELLALVKLGRLDEAKRLARPYLARYPNGPFSDRVRRALSTGRVDR